MGKETTIQTNQQANLPDHADRTVVSTRRSVIVGILGFLILTFLVGAIIYQRYIDKQRNKEEEALTVINNVRTRLQESLAYSISATKILAFIIQKDGSVTNFDSIGAEILAAGNDLDAVQMVPGGVIRYMYPLKGNEKVIGYDILNDPLRSKEALTAIRKKQLYFAGPFELRQGGMGVVGRLPIFRNNEFWGFTAVIIKMPTLLKAAGIDSTGKSGYYFQLSKINPDTNEEEFFINHTNKRSQVHSVSVTVPNGEWKLSVIPITPYQGFENILILAILGLLFSALGGIFIYSVSKRPKELNELVNVRTKQLKQSEENYKVLFERSPLPLWIYDTETFKFLEVNDAAVNLYGYGREEFLQMDVLGIWHEEDIPRFMDENDYTGDELREAGVWAHLKKNRQEIQVLVFSRNLSYKERPAKLILLMDVSEKIKIENELLKNEEKYRSLIEQASDGIILYSFDGSIHSFNKAAHVQAGYTQEEFENLNLKDLFFEGGFKKNRTKTNKSAGGQTTTLYRQLKRKDGSVFLVELNTRMLPDGKILAIVRDITEREKTEAALLQSEEQYRSLIERVSDAFISLNSQGNFTYVNTKAGEVYNVKPEDLIGKNIWKEFPDGTDKAFFNKCNTAFNTQEYQYLEEYYPPLEKWFQNHIYPSPDGLTIFFKDVTEIKKVSLALEEKEIKYRSLIEQASDGILLSDLEGTIQEANNSIAKMTGFEMEEMIGKHLHDLLPGDDAVSNPIRYEDLKKGKSLLYERRLLKKDGTIIEVEVNSKMASSNTLIGFIRDITDRKKNEDELIYQARLLDAVSDAIFSLDMNRAIVSWNQACEELYGFTAAEATGKKIPELVMFEYPNTNNEEVFKQVFKSGQWKGEFNFIHPKTNTTNHLLSSINLLKNKEGNANGFIITSKDITERKVSEEIIKLSEERYRTLVEQASDAIFIAGKDGRFIMVNSSGYKLSQYSEAELLSMTIYDLVSPEDLKSNPFRFQELENNKVGRSERRMRRKDGVLVDVEITAKFISGDRFLAFIRDVSERKHAEEAIRQSHERFELIAEATNEAVWDHDFGKNETWGNKKLYGLYGIEAGKDKINLEMFMENIHPDEREGVAERMRMAIEKSATSLSEEFRFMTRGEYRNFLDRAHIKYDEAGKPLKILGAMQDITEREIIKKQILKEKELSDSIINGLPGIFYLYNKEGRFLRWNKNFESVTGYTAEEISHLHPLNFFAAEDQKLLSEKIANVFVVGEDYVEADFLLKSGEKVPYYFTGMAIHYEGETCLMGVGLDFSEREKAARIIRESEEKYRTIIEQASDGIFIADEGAYFIDVNSAGCRMLGYTKEELLNKIQFTSLIPPEDLPQNPVKTDNMERGDTVINERRLIKKDGSLIDVEISAKVLFDGRYQSIVRDITERKKADKALRESEELLRELYSRSQNIREEERTHIAREIHDELGQQLTGLKMDISWINRKLQTADKSVSEKLTGTLDLVDTTIKTLRKIAMELRPSILDDLGLVAALEWQGEEFEKRSGVKVNFKSNLEAITVRPDITTAFFRIYQELLTNIARHAGAGIVNTAISIDDNQLHLSVEDNGTGFDIDNITSKKTLGLRGIKERTNLIGGNYEIKTKPGKGTFVLISVPL